MKLITKAIERVAPPLYSTENTAREDIQVVAKFFDPCGRMTFYMVEYDPKDRLAFGYIVSPLGADCDVMGYVSFTELESVRNRFGLGIERDRWFSPTSLATVMKTNP